MSDIPIPLTGKEIDTDDDASSILMTVGVMIVGFAALAWFQGVGNYLATVVNGQISNVIGVDPTSGEDAGGVPGV